MFAIGWIPQNSFISKHIKKSNWFPKLRKPPPTAALGAQEYYNDSRANISVFNSNDAQILVGLKKVHYHFIDNPNPSFGF